MRKAISVVIGLILLCGLAHTSFATQITRELSVQLSASVKAQPAQITLNWPQDIQGRPMSYTIFRKSPSATSWGKGVTLPGASTGYNDKEVISGTAYEYQIIKNTKSYTGYGYICAGVNVPISENRGKLLLVVEKTYRNELATELDRLQSAQFSKLR